MDVFGNNIEKECEKVFPKEEKHKTIELLRSENVMIRNNNINNNNIERSNIIEKKNMGMGKKFQFCHHRIHHILYSYLHQMTMLREKFFPFLHRFCLQAHLNLRRESSSFLLKV